MHKTLITISAAALVLANGCGSDKGGSSEDPKSAIEAIEKTLPNINEAVPADLRDRLSFNAATAEDNEMATAIPAGWTSKYVPGSYKPADDANLGFMTSFSVGSNCDGTCKPKNWTEAVEKVEFAQFAGDQFTIEKDEKLGDGGRLLIARSETSAYIVAAWWKSDASKYYYCRASLDDDAAKAIAAFEGDCRSTRVLAW